MAGTSALANRQIHEFGEQILRGIHASRHLRGQRNVAQCVQLANHRTAVLEQVEMFGEMSGHPFDDRIARVGVAEASARSCQVFGEHLHAAVEHRQAAVGRQANRSFRGRHRHEPESDHQTAGQRRVLFPLAGEVGSIRRREIDEARRIDPLLAEDQTLHRVVGIEHDAGELRVAIDAGDHRILRAAHVAWIGLQRAKRRGGIAPDATETDDQFVDAHGLARTLGAADQQQVVFAGIDQQAVNAPQLSGMAEVVGQRVPVLAEGGRGRDQASQRNDDGVVQLRGAVLSGKCLVHSTVEPGQALRNIVWRSGVAELIFQRVERR